MRVRHVFEPGAERGERRDAVGEVRAGRERTTRLRKDARLAAGTGVEHLDVRRVRVVALEQAHVVGGGTDHREARPGRERQHSGRVLEEHDRFRGRFPRDAAWAGTP